MTANYSPERREQALAHLAAHEHCMLALGRSERELHAIALLVCDDDGFALASDLNEALMDPSVIQAARALLVEAGL